MDCVLIHSPLVGPSTWRAVADHLTLERHEVVVPDLRVDAIAPMWAAQVDTVATSLNARQARNEWWLVAHSGAGPLLPAIDRALAPSIAGWVLVDAAMPHPGRSRFEELPEALVERIESMASGGTLPRWNNWFEADVLARVLPDGPMRAAFIDDLPCLPRLMFEEPLPADSIPLGRSCSYIQLSAAYAAESAEAKRLGWPVAVLDGDHLWPLTHPMETTEALLAAVSG